jgi:Zn-dependent peptidase ImmA (M78 family)/DNA-binding XRE family transcriptional regulator
MSRRLDDSGLAERIQQYRQERGWNQARIAEILGIDQAQVSRLENGKRRVTSIELATLADAFGVPTADLLDERPLGSVMRSAARTQTGVSIASLIEQATGMARIVRTLADAGLFPADNSLALALPSRGRMVDQGRRLAEALRAALGLGDRPLTMTDLIAAAEQRTGMLCWLMPIAGEGDGLYARDEGAALAVVNVAARPMARVRFTLAHEWGHHLFGDGTEGLCDDANVFEGGNRLFEMRANAFAAHLLLPASVVAASGPLSTEQLADLAATFGVSGDTAFHQASSLGVLGAGAVIPVVSSSSNAEPYRSAMLTALAIDGFNRRKLGSAPTEWVLGRALSDDEFDNGISTSHALPSGDYLSTPE